MDEARGVWRAAFPDARAILVAALVCVVAPTLLVGLRIARNPQFSPIDEGAHWDYLQRVRDGEVPRMGEPFRLDSLRTASCRGVALRGLVLPPCPAVAVRPEQYPGQGIQYLAHHPPTYYALTAPLAWIARRTLVPDEVDAARATGAVWLALGLICLWMSGRLAGVSQGRLGAGILLLAGAPVVVHQSSIINNDAPALLSGSLAAFLAMLALVRPGSWRFPVLALAGAIAVGMKTSNIMGCAVVALWQATMAWDDARGDLRAWWRGFWSVGGALLLGAGISALLWVVASRALALIDPAQVPTFEMLRHERIGLSSIAGEALVMLGPVTDSYSPMVTDAEGKAVGGFVVLHLEPLAHTALKVLLIVGGLGGAFVARREWHHRLGLIAVPALWLGGFALGVALWKTYDARPGLAGRYGLSVAPLLVLALVAGLRGEWLVRLLWLFALSAYGLVFIHLVAP